MPRMQPLPQDGLLYEALAARLADAIGSGRVKAGERLPSVRTLSQRYKVSVSTAVQAYRHLENQRLIEARPKSGFYAAPARAAPPEPRLMLNSSSRTGRRVSSISGSVRRLLVMWVCTALVPS